MKVVTKTDHYALVRYNEGDVGVDSLVAGVTNMMKYWDELHEQGLRPVQYIPLVKGIVCEVLPDIGKGAYAGKSSKT